ncbi:MAG: mannosyltransferase, partial [Bacteroidales bacterium]
MKNEILSYRTKGRDSNQEYFEAKSHFHQVKTDGDVVLDQSCPEPNKPGEILVMTSYPPRECGIATYSQDLIKALSNKFSHSMSLKVCALESGETSFEYPSEVDYTLKTSIAADYGRLAKQINKNKNVQIVLVQHEFGFF